MPNHAFNCLANKKSRHPIRQRVRTHYLPGQMLQANDHKTIDFASSDYLSLNHHPDIKEAIIQATYLYSFGSGASPFITGYQAIHEETECLFASWLGVDKALLFNTGYGANTSTIQALVNRYHTIISDKHCHASLLDGATLSRAKHCRYQHQNLHHLEQLSQHKQPDLIMTESVFSMQGDITPINGIVNISQSYGAGLVIDDAHGIGVLGAHGRGAMEHFNLTQDDYTCLSIPLSKAFNGIGGVIAGRKNIIEAIEQGAKNYCYSTALSPVICAALKASLICLQKETWRLKKLKENCRMFNDYIKDKPLKLMSTDITPIRCISIPDNKRLMRIQKKLIQHGFYVAAIREPSVPKGQSCLRICLQACHTKDHIRQLIDLIVIGIHHAT